MKRVKTLKVIAAFPTTADAMRMQICADQEGLKGRLIPVPEQIRAGCGIAWCSEAELREKVEQVIRDSGITTDGYYEIMW